jgi:threonylcarbamoyladenosine tRNA methylthiotransferase MtaB
MSVESITLGCRLNFAESETMRSLAPAGEAWTIVNSCAVTSEAVRQTRQAIRRARRRRPDARILVTGCAAELDPQSFATMPEVDRVVGNAGKLTAFTTARRPGLDPGPAFRSVGEPQERRIPDEVGDDGQKIIPAGFQGKVRSFVAVQTGCDHRCTFCSIWQARGESRSFSFESIRDAVARELDRGAKEVVVTGVDITSYAGGLGTLCQRLLAAEPRLKRLRLSSLDSIEIDDALHELIAGEPRLMPHFHLSLQAGDDMVLKRMKRRHSRADAARIVDRIKSVRSDATIGADLIAGFPTETEEMALNTVKLLEDCHIIAAHVFAFSPRPDTPAARMPQVDPVIAKARAARLREAASQRRSAWLARLVGTEQRALIENNGKGHTDGFAPIRIDGAARGETGLAHIIAADADGLLGVWA